MARHRIKRPGLKVAWKAMAIMGALILCLTMVLGLINLIKFQIYSMQTVLLTYFGFLLLIFGVSKLQRRRSSFFLTFFLGTTALAFLATMDINGYFGDRDLSLMTGGTFIFLGLVALISVLIIMSFKSLRNKRRFYQSFSFILFNLGALGILAKHLIVPGLHCYACPWATAGCPIGLLQNWVIMGQIPYYLLGTSVAIFTLFGRAFCGWACPFGFLHDIASMITNVKYKKSNLNNILSRGRRSTGKLGMLTYVTRSTVLIALLIGAWRYAETWFCKVCPAGFIEAALPYRLNHSVAPDPLFVFRVVIFFSLILIALIVSRFWCRYFCPLGHLAGHFNGVSMLQLNLDEEKCNGCGLCKRGCPMELDPESFLKKNPNGRNSLLSHLKRLVNKEQSNCILCGECVENCKNGALTISFLRAPEMAGGAGFAHDIKARLRIGALSQKRQPKVAYREDAIREYDYKKADNVGPEEPITEEYESEGQGAQKAFHAPPQSRRDTYKWPFPVTIYVF
ncbi:MAG: 4Fe-4S binding protein, partial [Candidatus Methanofastidiosa archaeon]|nr:4Fe-4S binding protein [Candidatus Methanofastidiosa archaeon]